MQKKINIGFMKLLVLSKINESIINNIITEGKELKSQFSELVNSSPILQLEFKIFSNFENKTIQNENIASRYIDSNIKVFENYTYEQFAEANNKLGDIITEKYFKNFSNDLDESKVNFYSDLNNLIEQTLLKDKADIESLHESFCNVLEYLKTDKLVKNITETAINDELNDYIIESAISKFNKKYDYLNEEDFNLIKKIAISSKTEKQKMLEQLKSENLNLLESITNTTIPEKINENKERIKNIIYDDQTIDKFIISLYELKKNLQ